jgi:hypothetical protein
METYFEPPEIGLWSDRQAGASRPCFELGVTN